MSDGSNPILPDEPESRRPSRAVVPALTAVVAAVLVLRHDFWFWSDVRPLLFGFMPVGLWWQALVTILASVMMWLLVRFAWPQWLEDDAMAQQRPHEKRED